VLLLGVHPLQVALAPGEAVQGARDVGASAEVNVQAALDWRDYMVSDYSDAGQENGWRIGASRSSGASAGSPGPAWSRWTAPATRLSTSS
jgi:hypothetical protein